MDTTPSNLLVSHDAATGETVTREMTAEELAEIAPIETGPAPE